MHYYNATFDNLDMISTVRDGIISLGKPNSKQVRHSLTMSLFEDQNNFIRNQETDVISLIEIFQMGKGFIRLAISKLLARKHTPVRVG